MRRLLCTGRGSGRGAGISKPYATSLVREMNEELKQKGFLTIPGRVSRRYSRKKFYGLRENPVRREENASVQDRAREHGMRPFTSRTGQGKEKR